MNTFATAAYRIGHTMVADDIFLRTNDCQEIEPGELDLVAVFWNPDILLQYGIDAFLKGFAGHTQYETDTRINSVLRNFLFNNGNPADPTRFGIDLASLNIQRGRDHGLPDYNTARRFYTGVAATKFSQITADPVLADSLQGLYGNINNVDLWIGVLAEDHLPGKSVGLTMHQMLKKQFENLRDGDFYFYMNDPFLSPVVRQIILRTKFSDVIKRNTSLTNLQSNVFFTSECPGDSEETQIADTIASQTKAAAELKISPNPANSIVTIDVANMEGPFLVKIFAANNVLMRAMPVSSKVSRFEMNVSTLVPGTYIVTVANKTDLKTAMFVKF